MQEDDFFIQSQSEAQKYFDKIDEAINAICYALFPCNPTLQTTGIIQPSINTCSYPANAQIEYLDYDILPSRPLDLEIMGLWNIRKYKLHFTYASLSLTYSVTFLRYEIDEYMSKIKNIGEMSFECCHFRTINVPQCSFKKLLFKNCVFKEKVLRKSNLKIAYLKVLFLLQTPIFMEKPLY